MALILGFSLDAGNFHEHINGHIFPPFPLMLAFIAKLSCYKRRASFMPKRFTTDY
jgi:hypothetical protein